MITMALLLSSCVRPLTCRTAVILRVVSSSLPVHAQHTNVSSQVTRICTGTARNRPSWFSLSSRISFSCDFAASLRQSGVCFLSQCGNRTFFSSDSVSELGSQKTESVTVESQSTTSSCSVFASASQETVTENAVSQSAVNPSQGGSVEDDAEVMSSEDNKVEFVPGSEPQSHSPCGLSSGIPQKHEENNSYTSHSAAESNSQYFSDELVVETLPDSLSLSAAHTDLPMPVEEEDLSELPSPRPMEPSFTLAPYVAQSEILQKLVALGVDLSAVEKVKEAADCLVQADWAADIQPRLLFLKDLGVEDSQLGRVLSKNPLVLKEAIEDMQTRVSYFESKKFSQEQIARIVTSAPLTLLLPVTYVDKKLGFLQKSFHLTGEEVRLTASRLPKIIPWKLQKLKDIRFYMKEMLGFSEREMKAMLLATPKVFLSDRHQLGKRFDYLHNAMGLSHQRLAAWPNVLRTRLHVLEQRHRFLLLMGRAQYDPTKENYVSLQALVSGRDHDFCFHVAKASISQFYAFLKSI